MTGFELNLKEIDKAKLVKLELLEPFWSKKPWSALLKGEKVLVILLRKAFAVNTIEENYYLITSVS